MKRVMPTIAIASIAIGLTFGCESTPEPQGHIVMPAPLAPEQVVTAPVTALATQTVAAPAPKPTAAPIPLDVAALLRGGNALSRLPVIATEPDVPFDPKLRNTLAPKRFVSGTHGNAHGLSDPWLEF